jgi:hypothetical protein
VVVVGQSKTNILNPLKITPMKIEFTSELRSELFKLETLSDSKLLDLFYTVRELAAMSKVTRCTSAFNFYTLHYRRIMSELEYRSL